MYVPFFIAYATFCLGCLCLLAAASNWVVRRAGWPPVASLPLLLIFVAKAVLEASYVALVLFAFDGQPPFGGSGLDLLLVSAGCTAAVAIAILLVEGKPVRRALVIAAFSLLIDPLCMLLPIVVFGMMRATALSHFLSGGGIP